MRLFAHDVVKEIILYVNEFYFNKSKVHLVLKPSPLIFDSMSSEEKKLSNHIQNLFKEKPSRILSRIKTNIRKPNRKKLLV